MGQGCHGGQEMAGGLGKEAQLGNVSDWPASRLPAGLTSETEAEGGEKERRGGGRGERKALDRLDGPVQAMFSCLRS